jgi:hypothetical protein
VERAQGRPHVGARARRAHGRAVRRCSAR